MDWFNDGVCLTEQCKICRCATPTEILKKWERLCNAAEPLELSLEERVCAEEVHACVKLTNPALLSFLNI